MDVVGKGKKGWPDSDSWDRQPLKPGRSARILLLCDNSNIYPDFQNRLRRINSLTPDRLRTAFPVTLA